METSNTSAFAGFTLQVICGQEWVRERCLQDPQILFSPELLLDPELTVNQVWHADSSSICLRVWLSFRGRGSNFLVVLLLAAQILLASSSSYPLISLEVWIVTGRVELIVEVVNIPADVLWRKLTVDVQCDRDDGIFGHFDWLSRDRAVFPHLH